MVDGGLPGKLSSAGLLVIIGIQVIYPAYYDNNSEEDSNRRDWNARSGEDPWRRKRRRVEGTCEELFFNSSRRTNDKQTGKSRVA